MCVFYLIIVANQFGMDPFVNGESVEKGPDLFGILIRAFYILRVMSLDSNVICM